MTLAYSVTASVLAPYIFGAADDGSFTSRRGASESSDIPRRINELDDAAWVTRIRDGDERAMREVVQRYADRLTRFAHAMLHTPDLAEAIAYDVLSDVWTRREQLRSDRSLAAYLFRAVRRRAWDEMERGQVRARYADRVRAGDDDTAPWTAPSPEALLLDRDDAEAQTARVAALRAAIATLPERRRLALHLRFEQELSYPAMGDILGLSDKAAQQLVLRTVGALRKALGI